MKTLGIITINNGRQNVLRLWCAQIKRLREEFGMFIPAIVVSGEEDKSICNSYHIIHTTQVNNPATRKWNTAMKYMRSIGMDYVMILGSDDIISTRYVTQVMELMEEDIDLIGTQTIYFYCGQGADRGTLVKLFNGTLKGIGKTVSKRVLDKCDWQPWDVDKNWGMDAIAQKNFAKHYKSLRIVNDVIVDVKTKANLNSFRVFKRYPVVPSNVFTDILSEEELQILKLL